MSEKPFWASSPSPDFNSRDFDKPTREPKPDPIGEAFGYIYCGYNKQLDGVLDEQGWKHFFARVYVTEPCHTLVDIYRVALANPVEFYGIDVSEGAAKRRELEIAKAAKIAVQVVAYNAAHPEKRYGLIQLIGDDIAEKADVVKASQGEIVMASIGWRQD